MIITGRAKVAAVMGWPIGHSQSPRLHGYWLEHYGIDGAMVPLAVQPDDLEPALAALPRMGILGTCITLPHKEAAFALVDRVDEAARAVGAVNVVTVAEDGTLEGTNTDVYGFIENLKAGAPDWQPSAGPAVVLGAGGAARAVIAGLVAAGVPEIHLTNRTRSRAETLAEELGGNIRTAEWNDRSSILEAANLLVNTSSLGMTGQPPLEIDLEALPASATVTDIVYAPLETGLLAAARARGNRVVDGLGMLLHQARPAFARWFGRDPEVTDALRDFVLEDLLRKRP